MKILFVASKRDLSIFAQTQIIMEENQKISVDFYIKYGLLLGLVAIIYLFATYYMGPSFMASIKNMLILIAISGVTLFYIGVEARKANGGLIKFVEAFKSIFFAYAAGMLLYVSFNAILFNIIDPNLPLKVYEASVNNTMGLLESAGVPEEQMDLTFEEFGKNKEKMLQQYGFGGLVQSYLTMLGMGAIFILVVSLIVKKEPDTPFEA